LTKEELGAARGEEEAGESAIAFAPKYKQTERLERTQKLAQKKDFTSDVAILPQSRDSPCRPEEGGTRRNYRKDERRRLHRRGVFADEGPLV